MRGCTIKEHLSLEEVRLKMTCARGSLVIRKWMVIYNAIVDPRPISEIAKHLAVSEALVYGTIKEYNERGPVAIEEGKKFLYAA